MASIGGTVDPRFEGVRRAFETNFTERGDIGACVSVVIDGRRVVDLWGGFMDAARRKPWQEDTVVNVWSLGKAMSALTLLTLMDEGKCGPDDPVARYWPEFAREDKASVTFRQLMSHQAGLCAVATPLPKDAFLDWDRMTNALAAQRPWWRPGAGHGYHTNTFGFLLGEPIRRLTGRPLREVFAERICARLAVDFYMGVPSEALDRCADLVTAPRPESAVRTDAASIDDADPHLGEMRQCIYNNPSLSHYDFNSRAWRQAEFPSTNPQSNARAVATIFGELAAIAAGVKDGVLGRDTLAQALEVNSDGEDLNLQRPTRFGLGFQLTQAVRPMGPNPRAFGHYGNGGHLGFADPDARLGFAYHMNHQGYAWRDPRNLALVDAVYDALD